MISACYLARAGLDVLEQAAGRLGEVGLAYGATDRFVAPVLFRGARARFYHFLRRAPARAVPEDLQHRP